MNYCKRFDNGLRLIVVPMQGFKSVSLGVMVKTGSINESQEENGISHFIEHTVFKGTEKRSSYEISDYIDRIGAQINAFTSKEITCYYTKSTAEHLVDVFDVLSDLYFNAKFDKTEIDKERGVIKEEILMNEDSPEDVCLDLLAQSYYGNQGLGRTILGLEQNIDRFSKQDVLSYMDKYYTADNTVISIAGDIDVERAVMLTEKYFNAFRRNKSAEQVSTTINGKGNLNKYKKIEQAHLSFCFPAFKIGDEKCDALSIASAVLGGGMSSRLFQKIREEMGLCYNIYSYLSCYKDSGVVEIYSGVSLSSREQAFNEIVKQCQAFRKSGITKDEFLRCKEQIKSSFIMGGESTSSQMLLYGKYMLFFDQVFDEENKVARIENTSYSDVNNVIEQVFNIEKMGIATIGPFKKGLSI